MPATLIVTSIFQIEEVLSKEGGCNLADLSHHLSLAEFTDTLQYHYNRSIASLTWLKQRIVSSFNELSPLFISDFINKDYFSDPNKLPSELFAKSIFQFQTNQWIP